jgi:hypothetical protein
LKASNLKAVWEAPDNSRLMKKQTSVRLATHIGAKIEAICHLFPAKSKSQVINDLLAAALSGFDDSFEFKPGKERQLDREEYQGSYREFEIAPDVGLRTNYLAKANEYLLKYEQEIGNDSPQLLSTTRWKEVGEK